MITNKDITKLKKVFVTKDEFKKTDKKVQHLSVKVGSLSKKVDGLSKDVDGLKKDVGELKETVATKVATKDYLKAFATKEDIRAVAEDIHTVIDMIGESLNQNKEQDDILGTMRDESTNLKIKPSRQLKNLRNLVFDSEPLNFLY